MNYKYKSSKWLREKYWKEKLSVGQIAKKVKVRPSTIFYWMEKLKVKRRRCCGASLKGKKNGNWKGGKYKSSAGYIYILIPSHPHATKIGYVVEHRLKMEKKLGRYLTSGEEVHHRNQLKDDNRIKNLELVLNNAHKGKIKCPYCQKEFKIR